MSLTRRIVFTALSTISLAGLMILYSRVLLPLNTRIHERHDGPYTYVVERMVTILPPIVGLMLLGVIIFQIYGAIKKEKARNTRTLRGGRRPPRRPP